MHPGLLTSHPLSCPLLSTEELSFLLNKRGLSRFFAALQFWTWLTVVSFSPTTGQQVSNGQKLTHFLRSWQVCVEISSLSLLSRYFDTLSYLYCLLTRVTANLLPTGPLQTAVSRFTVFKWLVPIRQHHLLTHSLKLTFSRGSAFVSDQWEAVNSVPLRDVLMLFCWTIRPHVMGLWVRSILEWNLWDSLPTHLLLKWI